MFYDGGRRLVNTPGHRVTSGLRRRRRVALKRRDLAVRMPCHNQQLKSGQEQPMEQVRFANSSNVPPILNSSEPSAVPTQPVSQDSLGPQLKLLPLNDQIRELQTIIRDK
ncbi:hypothetical protein GOODEAATRI_011983 [Goodea atripinnis]|uniref:Uncharacterized protein n=1 Tax=Goodea atripinnis TaxID=208336 RepID=A0ABV0MRE1_9TELE